VFEINEIRKIETFNMIKDKLDSYNTYQLKSENLILKFIQELPLYSPWHTVTHQIFILATLLTRIINVSIKKR
jgi:capsular polysaccharide biosynthesis protein